METLEIIRILQSCSVDFIAYKMGSEFACAVEEAAKLLLEQGVRIEDLKDKLNKLNATVLTPEDIAFFQSDRTVDICKRIYAAAEAEKI